MNITPQASSAALLSALAGDVYGKAPVHGPLRVFRGAYYAVSLFNFRRALKALWMRKHNIADDAAVTVN